ncbi:MAG: LamG domain-containing protein [Candidatus Pacebacteria bacterium]|nr:LamG domain-containing protein [Candidatus Paceibacterota bacterium]
MTNTFNTFYKLQKTVHRAFTKLDMHIYSMHAVRGLFAVVAVGVFVSAFVGVLFFPQTADAATLVKPANNLGLVGYWSMNDATSTKATDFSGNGNTGTLTNMAAPATATSGWGNGKLGGGLNFDGINDYVDAGNITALHGKTGVTYSAWIYRTGGVRYDAIISKFDNANGIDMLLAGDLASVDDIVVRVSTNGGTGYGYTSNNIITANVWHYVVMVYDGTQTGDANRLKLYVDNVQQSLNFSAGVAAVTPTVSSNVYIGYYPNTGNIFSGKIDEVRIYNRALSATEVTSLYNTGAQKVNSSQNGTNSTLDTGLVGLWSFDGKDMNGTTAYDRSGSGNNGTLTNGPVTTVGKMGQALSFDGTNDYVSASAANLPAGSVSRSVAFWIKTTYTGTGDLYAFGYGTGSNGVFALGVYQGGKVVFTQNGSAIDSGVNTIADGKWHHVIMSYTAGAGGSLIYIDGQNSTGVGGNFNLATSVAGNVNVGRIPHAASNYLNASIDEVRIYNRALSASEIKSLYNRGTATVNASRNTTSSSLDTGLVGLWSFDGKDMNGTTTAYDRSGSGNNGTLTNGPTPAIGKMGQALSFDGTNDYVSADTTPLDSLTTMTASFWINSQDLTTNYLRIMQKGDSSGATKGFGIVVSGTDGKLVGFYQPNYTTGEIRARTSITLSSNQWYFVTMTYDGVSTLKIYINGVDVSETSTSPDINWAAGANAFAIGRRAGASSSYFKGSLDDIRIYNRALSASEIKSLYNLGK